ncbi:hypothetical protein CTB91_03086 [Dickeya solani]|uniref:Uncharacterized protein n=1 Tax=Dickeya solani D s0432-1 TaxID=1231725 RepID=A0AAV3K7F2_9GAMM|nr:hypothetical protein CTB91_03086 [Dickeya solani]ERO56472.1 hypothetical protein A544_3021 [Dickeya solani D s0432-1]AYQ53033.1 hypothetical protein DSOL99_03083 [Dickeya solani]MBD3603295.1 hypothetical protein [Dickeya solani]NUA41115.1 hypothetical protein [Dickeya solani]
MVSRTLSSADVSSNCLPVSTMMLVWVTHHHLSLHCYLQAHMALSTPDWEPPFCTIV